MSHGFILLGFKRDAEAKQRVAGESQHQGPDRSRGCEMPLCEAMKVKPRRYQSHETSTMESCIQVVEPAQESILQAAKLEGQSHLRPLKIKSQTSGVKDLVFAP